MKNVREWKQGVVCLVMVIGLIAFAGGTAQALITGSAHDLSTVFPAVGEICVFCHTPHNADTTVADAPLWNHAITSQTFTPYSSASLDATVGQPNGISKLCLSCHDGQTALDAFGGNPGSANISGDENLTTDLTDDHPISFTFNDALATTDGELETPSTKTVTVGPAGSTQTGTIQALLLFNNSLECASCHDVHNNQVADSPLLRMPRANSEICLNCHLK